MRHRCPLLSVEIRSYPWLSSITVVASMQPHVRRDCPALEREVASLSDSLSPSLSRREGWEEAATEWMSTMAMELKTKNGGRNQKIAA
jgi:hypothetical protein